MELRNSFMKALTAGMICVAAVFSAGCDADEDEGCSHKNAVAGEVSAATCTEKGYTSWHCPDCGADYKKYIAPLGHDYGDWEYDVEPSEDVIGKKHHNCSRCDSVVSEDDPSKFVSHKCNKNGGLASAIIDNDGYVRNDGNDNGIDDDYTTDKRADAIGYSGDECSYNRKARDSNDSHYGKKHTHYVDDDGRYVLWDMNDDGDFFDTEDEKSEPLKFKTITGTIKD